MKTQGKSFLSSPNQYLTKQLARPLIFKHFPSGEVIEATLSGEVATSFNKDALMHSPVIAALTSMKVVENEGQPKKTQKYNIHVL